MRWVKRVLGASRETGGWAKAAGVGAAGGALAQSGAKRCMNSCDTLLCDPVRYPDGACGEYQSGAKWRELPREFMCCPCSFCKSFCGLAQRVAPAAAALWFCNQVCSVKKYRFVKVQRWFAVALDFQLWIQHLWIQRIRLFRLLQGPRAQGIRIYIRMPILYANPVGIPNKRR